MRHKRFTSLGAILIGIVCLLSSVGPLNMVAYAQEMTATVSGRVYSFGEDDHYDYTEAEDYYASSATTAYGTFTISGDMRSDGQKDGMASYAVSGDSVTLTYAYNDALLNADIESWHLVDDNTKTVAGITLNSNIKKGAIILQTSKDGINWLTDVKQTNVFADTPVQTESFYSANSIQLANGCYYRLIVAYKTAKKVGENQILFVTTDIINYLKTAEVYEFYLHSTQQAHNENVKTKTLGSVVNTGKDNGYSGSSALTISDPHYGWQIGEFFVSGYTRDTKDDDGTPVFLKNVGDQITLWFKLKQDIDCLNGSDILSISEDVNGYDQYFQTAKTNMGRGTLIIRYTDEKGIKHEPEIYTNYLAANATTSADTVVKLFEEGDYEVALDYEIKKTPRKVGTVEIVPEYSNYRIFFTFKVRNGNCMVYPFDVATGAELTNEAITPNGFRLDMARSRYLDIDVTRAVVTLGANGYVEDVRFNRPAKDGDQYTDEGIYTFSVKNLYTDESTTKKIYVGSTDYMKALSLNKITVTELNDQISQGGVIEADGTITMPPPPTEPETTEPETTEEPTTEEPTTEPEETTPQESTTAEASEKTEESTNTAENPSEQIETTEPEDNANGTSKGAPIVPIALGSLAVVGGAAAAFLAKKKKKE